MWSISIAQYCLQMALSHSTGRVEKSHNSFEMEYQTAELWCKEAACKGKFKDLMAA